MQAVWRSGGQSSTHDRCGGTFHAVAEPRAALWPSGKARCLPLSCRCPHPAARGLPPANRDARAPPRRCPASPPPPCRRRCCRTAGRPFCRRRCWRTSHIQLAALPHADDSSLLAVLLDVSPAGLAHLAATPGLGLQSLLEQVWMAGMAGLPAPWLWLSRVPLQAQALGCRRCIRRGTWAEGG